MYRLFVDSSTGLDVLPTYDFDQLDKKTENRFRSRNSNLYIYKWSSYKKFKVPVSFVNSSYAAIVNSWWLSNTRLLFAVSGNAAVNSVVISNSDLPIGQYIKPYITLLKGVIELETY